MSPAGDTHHAEISRLHYAVADLVAVHTLSHHSFLAHRAPSGEPTVTVMVTYWADLDAWSRALGSPPAHGGRSTLVGELGGVPVLVALTPRGNNA